MRITLTSVLVDDQAKALAFYTDVLGFAKKTDVPLGEHRWLTVVSPDDPDGVELVLEPDEHPAAGPFKAALVEDGIPFTSFAVDDVAAEYERLRALGVRFTQAPTDDGPGDHRRVRRHLRQPHPDRPAAGLTSSGASTRRAPSRRNSLGPDRQLLSGSVASLEPWLSTNVRSRWRACLPPPPHRSQMPRGSDWAGWVAGMSMVLWLLAGLALLVVVASLLVRRGVGSAGGRGPSLALWVASATALVGAVMALAFHWRYTTSTDTYVLPSWPTEGRAAARLDLVRRRVGSWLRRRLDGVRGRGHPRGDRLAGLGASAAAVRPSRAGLIAHQGDARPACRGERLTAPTLGPRTTKGDGCQRRRSPRPRSSQSGAVPAQQKAARTRRLRVPAWLLWLLVVGVATSLVVGVTLNLYRDPAPESAPASNGAAAVKLAPLLNPLSLGKAYPGCLDPRSHLDMMVLCPGDLADGWGYDAGLSQPQGVALPRRERHGRCAGVLGAANNGLTHVQEQVSVHSSPASAQAVIHRLSATPGTALCTNLSEPASSSVKLLPVATPDAAAAAVAWSVPATGRPLTSCSSP